MRVSLFLTLTLVLYSVDVGAESYFIDHRGVKVTLAPAPDRVVVRLTPGAWDVLREMPEVDLGPGVARRGELTELPLGPRYRGQGPRIERMLVDMGLAERAGGVYREPATGRTVALDRDLLVKVRDPEAVAEVLAATGLALVDRLGADESVLHCRAIDTRAALDAAVAAAGRRDVVWAIPDFRVPVELYRSPNNPYYGQQWYHHQANGVDISSEEAWDVTTGDPQVVVAVIDTGVEEGHADFDPARLATGFNAINQSNDPTPLTNAIDAHGTACAGSIVATADNNEGISGVCPGCTLMGIKMMDGMSSEAQLSSGYRAIEYATDNGAWVISNSWGNIPENYLGPFYDAVRDAVQNGRAGLGAVVLFASGNGRPPWQQQADQIFDYELQNMPEVMTVGGTGPDDEIVIYSNYGPNLSVVAPTGDIDPNNAQNPFDGPQIFTTDTFGNTGGFSRNGFYWTQGWMGDIQTNFAEPDANGDYTAYFQGTSAACPIAAGVVALTLSANPSLDAAQARLVVEQTADEVGGIDYGADGHDNHYGHGRVNAARAVRAAVHGFGNADGSPCAEDFNCEGGQCAKENEDDPEGICAQVCTTDADCDAGQRCLPLNGGPLVCQSICESHAECPAGTVCHEGACQVVACTDGSECPAGTACPAGGGACELPCASDADCDPPALCLPGGGGDVCQAIACSDGSECPVGTACPAHGGYCKRTCTSDVDCTQPELCLPAGGGDLCQAIACTDGAECPAGTACPEDGDHCVRSCESDADCVPPEKCLPAGSGHLCQKIACSSDADCPEDMECGDEGFCVPTTDECTTDGDCPEGWRCANGYCFDPGDGNNGDGGCGCHGLLGPGTWGGARPVQGLLALLALAALLTGRRRRS